MLTVLTYKNKIADIVDELGRITKDTEYEKKYTEFRKKYDDVAKENKVRIAFAGPYSVGKSSIIKGLTGKTDIKIGEAPTTGEICYYDYNGLSIVDTPGFNSGIPEHEEKAREVCEKADVIVFCTTPDIQLTADAAKIYELIASRESVADKIILCVNKKDKINKNNVISRTQEIQDSMFEVIDELGINYDWDICFISAEKYLKSFECEQEKRKGEVEASYFEELENLLDNFCDQKKVLSLKCGTVADTVSKFIQEIKAGEDKKRDSEEYYKEQEKYYKRIDCLDRRIEGRLSRIDKLFANQYKQLSDDLSKEDDENTRERLEKNDKELVEEIQRYIDELCDDWSEYITDRNSIEVRTEEIDWLFADPDTKRKGKKKSNLKNGSKAVANSSKAVGDGIKSAQKIAGEKSAEYLAKGAEKAREAKGIRNLIGKMLGEEGSKNAAKEAAELTKKGTKLNNAGKILGKLGWVAEGVSIGFDVFSTVRKTKDEKEREDYVKRIRQAYDDKMRSEKKNVKDIFYTLKKQVADNMKTKLQNSSNIQKQLVPLESELSDILSKAKESGNE